MRICVQAIATLAAVAASITLPSFSGPAVAQTLAPRTDVRADVAEAAQRFGIPQGWIWAIMRAESAGRIDAVSPAGARGLMQLMPATWVALRDRLGLGDNPFDPRDNIIAGAAYLRELYDRYGAQGFLAAYNAGPGRYEDWRDRGRALPPETTAYVARIAPSLQSPSALPAIGTASPPRPPRLSWSQSQLFTARAQPNDDASGSSVAAAPQQAVLAQSRQLNGLFAPVSGSRSQ